MNSYRRLRAWVHWVKLEKEPDNNKLMMAKDVEELLEVVEAIKQFQTISAISVKNENIKNRLRELLKIESLVQSLLSEDGIREVFSCYCVGVELMNILDEARQE